MRDQIGPAARGGVALRDNSHRQGPSDGQVRIVVGDREILGRIVLAVDAVAHVGGCGQCLEAVQQAGRHIKVAEVAVVERKRLMLPERRRVRPGVNQHVVHRAVGAAHQLCFTAAASAVQSTDHSACRPGLRILYERRCGTGYAAPVVEHVGVEGAREESPIIVMRARNEDGHPVQLGLLDTHTDMLS